MKKSFYVLVAFACLCCSLPTVTLAEQVRVAQTRQVSMLAFENAVALDIVGPLSVFTAANLILASEQPAYTIQIFTDGQRTVHTYEGIQILADTSSLNDLHGVDTLLVAGGPGVAAASENPQLITFLQTMNHKVRRLGSICGGALLFAKAGLLSGKKATTHWGDIDTLAGKYSSVHFIRDVNYVGDGHIYTSGGVMNGVQLALALVEEDYGQEIAVQVAKLIEVKYDK